MYKLYIFICIYKYKSYIVITNIYIDLFKEYWFSNVLSLGDRRTFYMVPIVEFFS